MGVTTPIHHSSYCHLWAFPVELPLRALKRTSVLEEGFHTLTKSVLFSFPTYMGHHNHFSGSLTAKLLDGWSLNGVSGQAQTKSHDRHH